MIVLGRVSMGLRLGEIGSGMAEDSEKREEDWAERKGGRAERGKRGRVERREWRRTMH